MSGSWSRSTRRKESAVNAEALAYWSHRYKEQGAFLHHVQQNQRISNDFLRAARDHPRFSTALKSPEIIEIGCGTGDLAIKIKTEYNTGVYYATDFCREAVNQGNRESVLNFWVFDILKDPPPKRFHLALSSNCLEHFSDPHLVIEKMFGLAPQVMVITPYRQPITDGYDTEGGAGHVSTFDEQTYDRYNLVDCFKFYTTGWTYSVAGEPPLQFAALITQKEEE